MAVSGNGMEYDITFQLDANLKTTTSLNKVVGLVAGTTTVSRFVGESCDTGTYGTPTATANHAIGILQSPAGQYSAGSDYGPVRLFGVSKAICADSVTAGGFVRAYQGISVTTMVGRIVEVSDAVTCSAATQSITSHTVILGRALESGQTGSVISVFLNPQMYDNNLVASTT